MGCPARSPKPATSMERPLGSDIEKEELDLEGPIRSVS
jgi:hypothetical protein